MIGISPNAVLILQYRIRVIDFDDVTCRIYIPNRPLSVSMRFDSI